MFNLICLDTSFWLFFFMIFCFELVPLWFWLCRHSRSSFLYALDSTKVLDALAALQCSWYLQKSLVGRLNLDIRKLDLPRLGVHVGDAPFGIPTSPSSTNPKSLSRF